MNFIKKAFNFIILTTKKLNIDDSHGLSHSMEVLNFANNIYKSELNNNTSLEKYKKVIYASALLHDMCDKKYVNEKEGLKLIKNYFVDDFENNQLNDINTIISTMSYSTIKKNGFPKNLNQLELPYHIVREADLLASYDFDRCLIYKMHSANMSIYDAYYDGINLFNSRVFLYNVNNLFRTSYSKKLSIKLHYKAIDRIKEWKNILDL